MKTMHYALCAAIVCVAPMMDSRAQAHPAARSVHHGVPEAQVRVWFPGMANIAAIDVQPDVRAVSDAQGGILGWVFATDKVAPVVRGKRGEIGVWVGLSKQGLIRGVAIGRHREDKKWFDRIRDGFYRSFEDKAADGSRGKPDAVTGATVSSKAMIDDIFGACRTVLDLPAVKGVQ